MESIATPADPIQAQNTPASEAKKKARNVWLALLIVTVLLLALSTLVILEFGVHAVPTCVKKCVDTNTTGF